MGSNYLSVPYIPASGAKACTVCIYSNGEIYQSGLWYINGHLVRHRSTSRKNLHGPLDRYVKFWVIHAPGMSGTFFLPPLFNDPDMHTGIVNERFPLKSVEGKHSRHSRCMRNPHLYVSGRRSMTTKSLTSLLRILGTPCTNNYQSKQHPVCGMDK